ncbi:cytochrome c1 [Rhizobium sp. EC-SD404]|uniref:cytochrome c1 n=1 Tax=Rhizobium sp. EC-SD404 TaxID=2038389 RepID=UPI001256C965|nr:cytochrome c1 [Rhizobium sp. EC-SD404]VVT10788.1 Cytochrome c1 [Rhizobium sp. EC-SD404]
MKIRLASLLSAALAVGIAFSATLGVKAAEGETPHYPINKPRHVDWSFGGPFGTYDKGQLQRGLKVYTDVCAVCHSMNRVAFRNLADLGYSEDQVRTFAARYEVEDGPDANGDMFTRPATGSDTFPAPFANPQAAAAAMGGAIPPDFSLIAKARAVERGFPTFVFDIFTMYAENGPDYLYSLLTGYTDAPEGVEIPEGTYYNPYYIAGPSLAMAPPLSDGVVTYDDGSPETLDQYAADVSAFLMWSAEPHLEDRKQTGFRVIIFLLIFAVLLFFTKKTVWSRTDH